jgi:hypothetical protein
MSFYKYGFICGYRASARANFSSALAQADYDRGYAAGQLELLLDIKQHLQLNDKLTTS